MNHIPILPLNPEPVIKELCEVWNKVAALMHFNVQNEHFDAIKDITNTKFSEVFPNFLKNQHS